MPNGSQAVSQGFLHVLIEDDIRHLVSTLGLANRDEMSGVSQRGQYAFALQIVLVHDLLDSHTAAKFADYEINRNPRPSNHGFAAKYFRVNGDAGGNFANHLCIL
jgi:hypothetical protein